MDQVTVNGVTYYTKDLVDLVSKNKARALDAILGEIEGMLGESQEFYDDMRAEGLQVSTIEAEGYLRAVKTIHDRVQYIVDAYNAAS